MRRSSTWQAAALAAVSTALFVGCPSGENPPEPKPAASQPAPSETTATDEPAMTEPEPPPPLTVPEVHMTEALEATCLVTVGDAMPDAELADLTGDTKQFSSLLGEKLTVVFFWTRGEDMYGELAATAALKDLQQDVVEPYGSKGVAVVAVNVRNTAEEAKKNIDEAAATYPNLADPEGEFFAQVATEELPRVYLLDAGGKINWFDVEFSRTSRRKLLQGIDVTLAEATEGN